MPMLLARPVTSFAGNRVYWWETAELQKVKKPSASVRLACDLCAGGTDAAAGVFRGRRIDVSLLLVCVVIVFLRIDADYN